MDPTEAGRRAARELKQALADVRFPVSRDRLADAVRGREVELGPGNRVALADVIAVAPDGEFRSAEDVARRLVLMGVVRARGRDVGAATENATAGREGSGTSWEGPLRETPPEGGSDHATAPPTPPSETRGVRRDPEA